MNIWHDISADRIRAEDFYCVIEIPKGGKNKYELDKETGFLTVDRILYTSTHYPANYGFIPRTIAGDHDPIDVLVLCAEAISPLCLVRCYPIGMIRMEDDGLEDIKIIAIPFHDPNYNTYKCVGDLPPHAVHEIKHFFNVYKQLEDKEMIVHELESRANAVAVIEKAIDTYRDVYGGNHEKSI